jgi:uncharacterized protein (DUF2147 family)
MKFLQNIFSLALLFVSSLGMAQYAADDILGTWLTSGDDPAKICITKVNGKYTGKIIWLKYPTNEKGAKKDINNPNETLKTQKIVGLVIMKNFTFKSGNSWTNGTIYDPENGSTYSCNISLKDKNTLEVRGYVGISLFGRTETWKRV